MCAEHGFDHMCYGCSSADTDCVHTGEEIINSDDTYHFLLSSETSQGLECVAQEGGF